MGGVCVGGVMVKENRGRNKPKTSISSSYSLSNKHSIDRLGSHPGQVEEMEDAGGGGGGSSADVSSGISATEPTHLPTHTHSPRCR